MFIQIQLFIEIKNHQMGVPRSVPFLNLASSSSSSSSSCF